MRGNTFYIKPLILALTCLCISILPTWAYATGMEVSPPIYVNWENTGTEDGTSWATGYRTIQDGIANSGALVWVKAGTYIEYITLKSGVIVYGGFAGNETQLNDRDWITNETIVDGNGSLHVVEGVTGGTIDGFKITGGNAISDEPSGGGIYNFSTSPTIRNCIITGNSAEYAGGGIYNYNSSPTIENCIITGNSAVSKGGGIYNTGSSPSVTNCTFSANSASSGGGIYNENSSSPVLTNCILWGDTAFSGNEMYGYGGGTNPDLSYSDIEGGILGTGIVDDSGASTSDGGGNINGNPNFVADDTYFHLQATSPCIDKGTLSGAPSQDIDGGYRDTKPDMGVDEYTTITPGTYYVDIGNGTDDKDHGTSSGSEAWKTFHYAIGKINGGSPGTYVLNVASGTYNLPTEIDADLTVYQDDFTIQGAGAEDTIINGNGATNWTYGIVVQADNMTIKNLRLEEFSEIGIYASGVDGIEVRNNQIIGTGFIPSGIMLQNNTNFEITENEIEADFGKAIDVSEGTGGSITQNTIYSGGTELGDHGIYIYSSDPSVEDNTIRRFDYGIYVNACSPPIKKNSIYDNKFGIYVLDAGGTASPDIWNNLIYDTDGSMDYGIYLYSTSGTTVNPKIYHNTIDGGNYHGIYLNEDYLGGSLSPFINYNIITFFNQYGIYGEPGGYGGSPAIEYNDVYGNSISEYGGDTDDQTGSNGNISEDPLYASYELQNGSPCIDAIPIAAGDPVTVDLDETSRPKGSSYDMGAYEYVPRYDLTVTTVGQGTVTLDPTGGTYDEDTVVTLTAAADSGWVFSGWSGDLTGSTNPETVTMNADKSVTATFLIQLSSGNYYVDASQTSEGDGSESSPFKTLHNAVEHINNGSSGTYVLSLSAGTYSVGGGENDQSLIITQNNVTIIGESGSSPVLDGTDASTWGYGIGIAQAADNVTIYNLEIANFPTAGLIITGTGASVTNCNIHDNGTGIWIESTASSATIKENQVHENGTGYDSIGVWIRGASGVTVAGNQIYTHEYYGIGVEDCSPTIQRNEIYGNDWSGIDIWAYIQEASPSITNNLIYSGASGITMSAMEVSASPGIYHNTIDAGTEDGIYCHGTGATPDIKYNAITDFEGYGINNIGGSPTIAYNDVYGNTTDQYGGDTTNQTGTNGNISQDPLYGSYELQSGSPCINAIPTDSGDPVTVDYSGYARPKNAGYDMGAYEFITDIAHGFTLPGGTGDATDYQMFTVPVTLASGSSLKEAMEGVLGTYDKVIWRVFAWDPGTSSYIEMDDSSFAELEVYPGRGFWVISTSTDTITFSGQPAPDGDYTEVPLSPGWNMVALPWPATIIELDRIAVSDGLNTYWVTSANNSLTQQHVWDYTGTGANNGYEQRASGATLQPGTAYWIKVEAGTDIAMLVPKDNEGGYFTASSVRTASEASTAPASTEQPPPPPGLSVSFDSTSSDGGTTVSGSGGCFIGTVTPKE